MRLPLINKTFFLVLFLCVLNFSYVSAETIEVPVCPQSVKIINGKIIGASAWSYSFDKVFVDKSTNKNIINDTVLTADYILPEISEINTYTNSVTGGLSPDDEEVTNMQEKYTWNIEKINKSSIAVFYCNLVGDESLTPVPYILLYKKIPADAKKCTVSFNLDNEGRFRSSQKVSCE